MRRTILVADDSPTIRRLVTQIFADGNFRIVEVNNGDAAIKSFEEVRPSVVLADIYMPGRNGYQVCTYVRQHPQLGQTPVVLLVGAFDAFDDNAAKQAGATASITKPFEPGALIELVTSIMPTEVPETEPQPPREAVPAAETVSLLEPSAATAETVEIADPPPEAVPAAPESEDLLGLESIFKSQPNPPTAASITEQDIDRIVDRVIQRLSTRVIESIAWEVVPDITERIVREEMKRRR
jgi:CheY-like chemotaxis protein